MSLSEQHQRGKTSATSSSHTTSFASGDMPQLGAASSELAAVLGDQRSPPSTAEKHGNTGAGMSTRPVHQAIAGIRGDAIVRLCMQAQQGKALLEELCTSQCRLAAAMSALRQDPGTPGGVAERDTAFQLRVWAATALLHSLDEETQGVGRQEEALRQMQQLADACDDTFDTEDVQVDLVMQDVSAAHRAACDAIDTYTTATGRMATVVRTSTAELCQAEDATHAAADEVVAAEARLQGCRNRAAVAGSALLATLASARGKRALCESILQEAAKRPNKARLLPDMEALYDSLYDAEDLLDDHRSMFRRLERRGLDTGDLEGVVNEAAALVHQRRCLLEDHEQCLSEALVRFYPELDVSDGVRKWGGLLCKRDATSYRKWVSISKPDMLTTHGSQRVLRGDGATCVLRLFGYANSEGLLREARLLQRLRHPCVAEARRFFETITLFGWALEVQYYPGGDLSQHMQRIRQEGMAAVSRVVLDVAQGLAYLHRNGIVHCDIKPSNILFEANGSARLADYSIAYGVEGRAEAALMKTYILMCSQGVYSYMAPEVVNRERARFVSDVYSLGLVLYDMVVPEQDARSSHVVHITARTQPPPVRGVVPAHLEVLLGRMLSDDAAGRPTAEEVVLDPFFSSARRNSDLGSHFQPPVYWHDIHAIGGAVDVTGELGAVMQTEVNRTYTGALGQGHCRERHKGLRVEAVLRVEHVTLWKEYQFRKSQIQQHMQNLGIPVRPLCPLTEALGTGPLSRHLNEVRLFHGTTREAANRIVLQGMDERACTRGPHGTGLYFGECSSKSDETMVPASDGLCDLLVCRVLLGLPSFQTGPCAPDTRSHHPMLGHSMMDSVVTEVRGQPREFLLFDRTSVFPEYVLRVRRVGVENPQCA